MGKGFCERKFSSMFLSGTFTKAVMYIMLLCDSIIAGYYIGASGVAAINAITPVTGIVTFFGDLVSTGVGIVFTREIGARRKKRADEIIALVTAEQGENLAAVFTDNMKRRVIANLRMAVVSASAVRCSTASSRTTIPITPSKRVPAVAYTCKVVVWWAVL